MIKAGRPAPRVPFNVRHDRRRFVGLMRAKRGFAVSPDGAWLVAAGPRTRGRIAQAAQPLAGLSACIGDEAKLRQHVDTLATR